MTKASIALAMLLLLAPSFASAQDHRPGDAALGALSGAVVLGADRRGGRRRSGYAAGPSIARSWGFDRARFDAAAAASFQSERAWREGGSGSSPQSQPAETVPA